MTIELDWAADWEWETPSEAAARERSDAGAQPTEAATQQAFNAKQWQPPESSITGGLNSQLPPGGVDWLSVSLHGSWKPERFKPLLEQLENLKGEAQERGGVYLDHPEGGRLYVRPGGLRRGPWFFDYVLEHEGIVFLISRREDGEKSPNVFVDLGSMVLMQRGHVAAFAHARSTLESLGWKYFRGVGSRIDCCVDLVGVAVQWFAEKMASDAYVCRAVHDVVYRNHKRVTGCVFGKGIKCRVYDKLLETADQPLKREVMRVYRWGGEVPEVATRVEFQLRREQMREDFAVGDIYDLFDKLGAITHYLTKEWLRFTDSTVDRGNGHQSRSTVADVWAEVVKLFGEVFARALDLTEPRKLMPGVVSLAKQMFGCGLSMLAVLGQQVGRYSDRQHVIETIMAQLDKFIPADAALLANERVEEFNERNPFLGWNAAESVPF